MNSRVWWLLVPLFGCGAAPPPQSAGPGAGVPANTGDPTPSLVVAEPQAGDPGKEEPVEQAGIVEVGTGSGWAQFHGNAGRTGATAATAITRPKVLWSTRVGIQGYLNGPVALGAQVVIVPSSGTAHNKADADDGVHALDFSTGKRIWHARFDQDANGVAATASQVFATSDDGRLYALDIRDGTVLWKFEGQGKMYSHPLLVGETVVVGDSSGTLYAVIGSSGKLAWQARFNGAIRGGASADASHIFVASQGGDVAKLTFDGKIVWKHAVKRPPFGGRGAPEAIEVYSPPVVDQDMVIVPFARDTTYDVPALVALDKRTGKDRWRAKGPGQWGNVRTTPALVAGTLVYAEPYSGDIVGVSTSTGRMLYRHAVGPCLFPSWSSPAAAGDVVYVPRFDGTVHAVRATTGKELWQVYLGERSQAGGQRPKLPPARHGCSWEVTAGHSIYAPAAVAEDGTLFVGTAEGWLFAIGGS